MALQEIGSPDELSTFLKAQPHALVCFSATWCGPCRASKPAYEALANKFASDAALSARMRTGIAYEHDLGDATKSYGVRAFPTYIVFIGEKEAGRVEGADLKKVEELVGKHCRTAGMGPGHSLGGNAAAVATPSAEEARAQRLARFGAVEAPAVKAAVEAPDADMEDASGGASAEAMDVVESGAESKPASASTSSSTSPAPSQEMVDPTEKLSKEDLETLTVAMGFPLIRAQKGLLHGGGTAEGAVEWLLTHQEDDDIDEPIAHVPANGSGMVAQSYKCNECSKILSNMANLELHANKTGHSDFQESTEIKKPLTDSEKKAKVDEIKSLLKAKRAERETVEKVEDVDREKMRRSMGKETIKTKDQMEREARKRTAQGRKREKDSAAREKKRIMAEIEKDKLERIANKGRLNSRLGAEGYNPSGIQYGQNPDGTNRKEDGEGSSTSDGANKTKPKKNPSVARLDDYIKRVSSYRAGGDGGNCLKILKAYVGNAVKHPGDAKYGRINMENKAYKTKVKPFVGAKSLLLAVGFNPAADGTALELDEGASAEVLALALEKLEKAYEVYMK